MSVHTAAVGAREPHTFPDARATARVTRRRLLLAVGCLALYPLLVSLRLSESLPPEARPPGIAICRLNDAVRTKNVAVFTIVPERLRR